MDPKDHLVCFTTNQKLKMTLTVKQCASKCEFKKINQSISQWVMSLQTYYNQ